MKVGDFMREEYDIKNLNPRKNPYAKKLKRQITINIDVDTIDYFKSQSESNGIPYQTLINLYLADCVKEKNNCKQRGDDQVEYQVTIESGPLAQFMSPVAHTHKCKNCAEEMENQTNFSVQQPVRVFLKI